MVMNRSSPGGRLRVVTGARLSVCVAVALLPDGGDPHGRLAGGAAARLRLVMGRGRARARRGRGDRDPVSVPVVGGTLLQAKIAPVVVVSVQKAAELLSQTSAKEK